MVIELSEVQFDLYLIGRARSVITTLVCIRISLRSRRLLELGERENGRARGRHACVLLARLFFLVPTTSKRLLRRLYPCVRMLPVCYSHLFRDLD